MMKNYTSIKILFTIIFLLANVFSFSFLSAATSSKDINVNLMVGSCNNNTICEPPDETILSCPADCFIIVSPPGGGGGGKEDYDFEDLTLEVSYNSVIFRWKTPFSTKSSIWWGTTSDYSDGVLTNVNFLLDHEVKIDNLKDGTLYYFMIQVEDSKGNKYTTKNRSFTTLFLPDTTPPGNPTNITTKYDNSKIQIFWDNPLDKDFDYIRVMRSTTSYPKNPFDGDLIYEGNGTFLNDYNVVKNTKYFYTLFSRDFTGNFSSGAPVSVNYFFPPEKTFCELNPADQACTNPSFCDQYPNDTSCKKIEIEKEEKPTDLTDEKIIDDSKKQITENIIEKAKNLTNEITNIFNTKLGDVLTKIITGLGIISGLALGIISSLFLNPLSFSELFLIPLRLWGLLMTALGFRKRNKPWGTVYDSITKQPLDPAYVILQDMQGNEVATSITDLDGRYGFLVPAGTYRLVANKTNYEFPSKKLVGKTVDEIYPDLYFGDIVEVTSDGAVIAKNIPMDPLKFDWNEFEKNQQHLMKFYSRRNIILARVSDAFFYFGFVLTIIAVLASPKTYNIITMAVYLTLFIFKRTILRPRPFGTIKEKDTGNPLSFALLHVYTNDMSREVIHRVADKTGKFYCLIPNGTYSIKIEKKNPDESYSEVYSTKDIEVQEGFINIKFKV